jgi:hypothetical protein
MDRPSGRRKELIMSTSTVDDRSAAAGFRTIVTAGAVAAGLGVVGGSAVASDKAGARYHRAVHVDRGPIVPLTADAEFWLTPEFKISDLTSMSAEHWLCHWMIGLHHAAPPARARSCPRSTESTAGCADTNGRAQRCTRGRAQRRSGGAAV